MISMSLVAALSLLAGAPLTAKVAAIPLAELARQAQFIGIVKVERVSSRIPFLLRSRAMAIVLDHWKGTGPKRVTFVASPTWACDISDANEGETAVVFLADGKLLHAGRGRMPLFTRNARTLAAVSSDVCLPADMATEDGPDPKHSLLRGVAISDLRDSLDNGGASPGGQAFDQRMQRKRCVIS